MTAEHFMNGVSAPLVPRSGETMNQKRVAIVLGVAVATAVSAVLGFSVAFSYAVLDAEVPDPDEFDVKEE